ncbi:dipeptide/oligopeptide/nickel ABC transporter permease/ATP-binding protein [Dactylosporangium sp. CA-092794]|uniref:dipeptide/oligopeptide/nickel ABC transporter permease/ATP-binding protein n=1 Tax=Dactylosporangium sp. CA-092794 TaxID=3239929 RepID=UPI003D9138A5
MTLLAPKPSVVAEPGFLRRLLRRPAALICGGYIVLLVLVAVVAPIVLPHVATDNAGDLSATGQGPSTAHPLGTDSLGRDVLARLLVGTRPTMIGVLQALVVALALAVPVGLAAGYRGGWLDRVVGWLADLIFSLPGIIIVIVVLAVFPGSTLAAMTTLGLLASPGLMRVIRSVTLPLRDELYVQAARTAGLRTPYLLSRHILPRIGGTIVVQASFFAAAALTVQSGLAFLSLLAAPPAPSWGGMVADGAKVRFVQPWLSWPPGIAIGLTILAFCLLGDAVRDAATEGWTGRIGARMFGPGPRHLRTVPPGRLGPGPSFAGPGPATARCQEPLPPSLLAVEGLSVAVPAGDGDRLLVEGVSFDVRAGETVGIVGESGCGKTVTTRAITDLLPGGAFRTAGRIRFDGVDLAALGERELRRYRGRRIAVVSQEPMASFDPLFRVGDQIAEAVRRHLRLGRAAARARAVELLASVHLPDPAAVARAYPHELSGGMAQRAAIARALAGEPQLLIADEPTTALDVTVQAGILDLLRELRTDRGMAILLVTHDWGIVADSCDRVVVMYAGEVVERAQVGPIFAAPRHPYTQALLASDPHEAPAGRDLPTIPGTVPPPGAWPPGCRFRERCALATAGCERPIALIPAGPGQESRCIRAAEVTA